MKHCQCSHNRDLYYFNCDKLYFESIVWPDCMHEYLIKVIYFRTVSSKINVFGMLNLLWL